MRMRSSLAAGVFAALALVLSACGGGHKTTAAPAAAPAAPAAKVAKPKAEAAKPASARKQPKAAKPAAASSSGIPQHNGGDQDPDNNGGPDDGDGNL
jgi:hypothetical protein